MLAYVISVIAALLLAFLCGAIPFALIIGKSMRGLDVREHGSGNAGSTNAIRVLGLGPGLLVFAGDVLKAALGCVIVILVVEVAVPLSYAWASQEAVYALLSGAETIDPLVDIWSNHKEYLYDIPKALAILATVLGHMFSPFMRFKGGKGVAAALGAIGVVLPLVALCSLTVFALITLVTRYVSLGSVIAVVTVPIFTCVFYPSPTYIVFTALLAVAVVLAHHKNIKRLIKREESKFSLSKKEKDSKADVSADNKKDAKKGASAKEEMAEIDAAFADDNNADNAKGGKK